MIFISYRRDDSQHITDRIFESLVSRFGKDSFFKDIENSIPLGQDSRRVIRNAIGQSNALLVIIGRAWLNITDQREQRRIDQEDDFVRCEIEEGLHRGIPVIPILVDRAEMPRSQELPFSLSDLPFRNAAIVRPNPDFHRDMNRLIQYLEIYHPISPRSQKMITLFGIALGISWVVASIIAVVAGHNLPPEQQSTLVWYALGFHPYSKGIIPVQLLTYSFIHGVPGHLIGNLLSLYGLIYISRLCLSFRRFVGLYSLGAIIGALVYLLMSAPIEKPLPLIGAGTALAAVAGALAVFKPKLEIHFFGLIPTRLAWIVIALGLFQLFGALKASALPLGMLAGLITGVLYAVAVRIMHMRFGE